MKKRVLSLTMAFLLAFTMLPTQAAAEELPEYEKIVEESTPAEESLEEDALETEPAEEPTEEVTEAPTEAETEETEVKEEVPAEQEETEKVPAEEIQPVEQQVSVQAMEANGVAVQAEDGETECTHPNATETECPDCGITWCIKDDAGTKYTSLKDAFDNAPDGSTLTLLKDTSDGNDYKIIDKNYTIDPAGHTLECWNITISRSSGRNTASLTLTGRGKIKASINVNSVVNLCLPETWNGSIKTVNILSGMHDSTKIAGGTIDRLVLYVNSLSISGGTFNEIKNNLSNKSDSIPVRNLLETGYVFKQNNQTIEYTGEVPGWNSLYNLTVEKCEEHRDKNGDNICDFCNQSADYIVEVTKDGSTARYSGLQGAFNEAQDGATVKLLTDIPARTENAAYTVDKKQITLDLNSKTISGNGISVTNGANLMVTGDGSVVGELTFDSQSTGKLSGGKFGKVVSNNSGKSLEDLLEKGYAYRESNGDTWKSDIYGTSIDDVKVLLAPIRELEIEDHVGELTYGYSTTEQLNIIVTARMQDAYEANHVEYKWYKVVDKYGVESLEFASDKQQFSIPADLGAGEYTYRVYAAYHGYKAKVDVTFEVKKADAKVIEAPTASHSTYAGYAMALIERFGVAEGGTFAYSLEKDGKYDSIPRVKEAGEYTVWYKVIGDDNHNDSEPASVTATICYFTTDAAATLAENNKGQNGWYTGTVTIQAPTGYTISSTLEGSYKESFTTDTNGENTYYLRQDSSGFITDAKTIQVPIDTQAPTKPTLSISKEATDTTVTLQASATDEVSGVLEYTLLETSGKIPPQTSKDGVFDLMYLNSDEEYNFTVTAEDNAGHTSEISDIFNVKTRKIPFANAVVTLKNADKIYNGTAQTPDVEVAMNGTVLADTQYVVSYEQDGTAVVAPTKAGTYKVVVTASENGAYEGTASDQPAYTIAKKTITAELNGTLTKTYDGTADVLEEQKLAVLLNGVEDGDEVTAAADTYNYNGVNVKDADTITGNGITLAGADAGNYQLAETKVSVRANILPKDLAKAEVTLGEALIANGKTQTQTVEKVMLDGTELTVQDYEVTGNQAAAAGSYTLTITGKNNYTGKVQRTYVLVPAAEQMVSNENGDVKIGEGTVKVSVSAGQDVPEISLVSDKKVLIRMLIQGGNLSADEIVLLAEGATIELALNVEHAEASVSADAKAAMEKTAGEFTIGRYLNITFTKSVNGESETEIHEINVPIKISFRLSSDLLNTNSKVKREYMVLRNHDGEVTTLVGTFADGSITFETDRFSDYAIAWKDTAVSTSGSKKKHKSGSAAQEETAAAATEVSQLVQAQSAPTGDQSPLEWMLLLAALSAAGIGMTLARKRKG